MGLSTIPVRLPDWLEWTARFVAGVSIAMIVWGLLILVFEKRR